MSDIPELTKELGEKMELLSEVVRTIKSKELFELKMRLKRLQTEALTRSLDWRKVSKEYAKECVICNGSGHHHFCVNPYCKSSTPLERDDCLHFTPHELGLYSEIHKDYLVLLKEAVDLIESGISPKDLLKMSTTPTDPLEIN